MPIGCFNLPCLKKKSPVKTTNYLDLTSFDDDYPWKKDLLDLSSEDLSLMTGPENLIGLTHLGKLYRGRMLNKDVAVKVLSCVKIMPDSVGDDRLSRFKHELKFLQAPGIWGNPNIARVIGCCRKENSLGIVYDLNPLDTLQNVITRADFKWPQRVRAALKLARLLNYLHDGKYLIRNFAPHHIVVDQDYTPIVFEFGLLVGGVLGNTISESDVRYGPGGYYDPFIFIGGFEECSFRSDVYAFGILLLNLISKRVFVPGCCPFDDWASTELKRDPECSLVHQSFEDNPDYDSNDGSILTELVVQCVEREVQCVGLGPNRRPEMKKVVERLEALNVVQKHGW